MALIDYVSAGPVGVDTAIFIYFIEEHDRYLPSITPLLVAADEGKVELVACALTLLEVLVVPYRAGDIELAERYEAVLTAAAASAGVRRLIRSHFAEIDARHAKSEDRPL